MELRQVQPSEEAASRLIRLAFGTNTGVALDYSYDFVRSSFAAPGVDESLSPAFYEGETLVSMMASFPRLIRAGGADDCKVALLTWNSVHPDFRHRGLGTQNVKEATLRARAAGYDGVLLYCLDGSVANSISLAGVRNAGVPCSPVFTVEYLMGRIPRSPSQDIVSDDSEELLSLFLQLSTAVSKTCEFSRIFSRSEAEWECLKRYGAVTEVLRAGARAGLINGYVMMDAAGNPLLFIESVLWGDLLGDEKKNLVTRFLNRVAGQAMLAVLPLMEYAETEPFRACGFRKVARKLHAYLSLWNQDQPQSFSGMYVDVF